MERIVVLAVKLVAELSIPHITKIQEIAERINVREMTSMSSNSLRSSSDSSQ